jgi:peroxiredoxin
MRFSKRALFAGTALILSAFTNSIFAEEGKAATAPLFTCKTTDGGSYSLSENLGKGPIVVSFWATWCGPCILEMKNMKKIYEKYAPQGLQMLCISIDDNKTQSQVPGVVHSYKFPYTILLDGNKDVYKAFHVANVPQLFVIDAKGTIVYNHQGYQKGDEKKVEAIIVQQTGDKK